MNSYLYQTIIDTPIGNMIAISDQHAIHVLDFIDTQETKNTLQILKQQIITGKTTALLRQLQNELDEYFAKKRTSFSVPMSLSGSQFQKKVLEAVLRIPYGKTKYYKDIALKINNPKAFRAVGNANAHNPIVILIPCHRVINLSENVGNYRGGIRRKTWLLAHENW